MPKTDLVPCFYAGSSQRGEPDFIEVRENLHQWKKDNLGSFEKNPNGPGHVFQMYNGPAEPGEVVRAFSRGQSLKIDEPTRGTELGMMSRFVMGCPRAVAAVNSYRNHYFSQTVNP